MVGGATRMTGSGLSITEWKPIHGVIPPLNHAEWLEEFDKYRQIPQYQQINKGMALEEFQFIFWWEWAHRMLARFVGFLVAVPLAFFWLTGRLNTTLKYRMLGLLALGGFQGAIGWWMVASGLSERTSVSQYRGDPPDHSLRHHNGGVLHRPRFGEIYRTPGGTVYPAFRRLAGICGADTDLSWRSGCRSSCRSDL